MWKYCGYFLTIWVTVFFFFSFFNLSLVFQENTFFYHFQKLPDLLFERADHNLGVPVPSDDNTSMWFSADVQHSASILRRYHTDPRRKQCDLREEEEMLKWCQLKQNKWMLFCCLRYLISTDCLHCTSLMHVGVFAFEPCGWKISWYPGIPDLTSSNKAEYRIARRSLSPSSARISSQRSPPLNPWVISGVSAAVPLLHLWDYSRWNKGT